ncbi:uncharacterized protein [Antedon mediterranea]|uniref:uncharacterized protein n=1 Tax=Antedon mediterranea TaxID=105859 RepID=UPI003AF6983F
MNKSDKEKGRGRGRGRDSQPRKTIPQVGNRDKTEIKHEEVPNGVLMEVARELPRNEWKNVFRSLMKEYITLKDKSFNIETRIEEIEHKAPNDLQEIKYQALMKWKNCMGKDATTGRLKEALTTNKLKGISDKIDAFVTKEKKTEKAAMVKEDQKSFSEDTLRALLQRVQSDVVKFKQNPSEYIENKKAFMEDIVSMWNTPHRGDAHIVIGVNENFENDVTTDNEFVGIQEEDRRDNSFYNAHFDENYFNYKPDFVYTEKSICIKGQSTKTCFGVFIVRHNEDKAKTEPCVTKMRLPNPDTSWMPDLVLVRSKGETKYADGQFLDDIHNWFGSSRTHTSTSTSKQEGSQVKQFLEYTDNFMKTRAFVLITDCPLDAHSDANNNISDIGCVNWVKVFDFDINSPKSGILKECQDILDTVLNKTTWTNQPVDLNTRSTNWYFPLGNTIEQEHVLQDFASWKTKASGSFDMNCTQLAEYCASRIPLTALVLWYGKTSPKYLSRLLFSVDVKLAGSYKLILCCNDRTADEISELKHAVSQDDDNTIISDISLETVCEAIKQSHTIEKSSHKYKDFQLPRGKPHQILEIQPKDALWLKVCVEVLYLNHDYRVENEVDDEKLGFEFHRGGVLTWNELKIGGYDATRDLTDTIKSAVVNNIRESKSGIIELYHDPGSGGTTLGRRVLWEIHLSNKAPCVNATSSHDIKALSKRIEFLYQHTLLPIVVLLDGSDNIFCRQLLKILENCIVVILLVQRTVSKIRSTKDRFYLTGKVSEKEAANILFAFLRYTSDKQRLALTDVATSVNKNDVHVFEFGLAAYEEKYKGVHSYVKGYLEYDPTKQLCGWQRVVSFLALAYYYGHASIPAQFFAEMLRVSKKSVVTLENIKGEKFIIETSKNGIKKWRITHYAIAREILEQLLGQSEGATGEENLSIDAKRKIGKLTCDLIEAASNTINNKIKCEDVMNVFSSMIIIRNSENDDVNQKKKIKPKLSRLMSDIPSESPYEERLEVLRKLIDCFPQYASGWAHLGRFYCMCRQNEIPKAIECITKAIDLQEEIKLTDGDQHNKELSNMFHMLGCAYNYDVRSIIGDATDSQDHETLEKCVESTQLAIDNFIKCRKYVLQGRGQTYGYNGELSARLTFIEFIKDRCFSIGLSIEEFLKRKEASHSSKELVRECFSKCEMLILEWNDIFDEEYGSAFSENVNRFHLVFKGVENALKMWSDENSVRNRRSKITAYKLKYRSHKQITSIDMVTSPDDVKKIVQLHEANINQICEEHTTDYSLDYDAISWIRAIRSPLCKPTYTIEKVIGYVQKWYAENQKSPRAVYYMFALNLLLGIGVNRQPGLSANFKIAKNLLQDLQKINTVVSTPGLALEWIGKGDGISRLVEHRTLKLKSQSNTVFWKSATVIPLLDVQYGHIVDSSKRVSGRINLMSKTVGAMTNPISVSFDPIHEKLYGERFNQNPVAFNLAFTMNHGLKAYNVCEVKRIKCKECNLTFEYSALDKPNTKYYNCPCNRGRPIRIECDNFQDY